jgi:hypothetical protein
MWAGRLNKIMATRKQHSPEQVVRKLLAADRLLDEGNGHRCGVPRARCRRSDVSPVA